MALDIFFGARHVRFFSASQNAWEDFRFAANLHRSIVLRESQEGKDEIGANEEAGKHEKLIRRQISFSFYSPQSTFYVCTPNGVYTALNDAGSALCYTVEFDKMPDSRAEPNDT